MPVRTIRGSLAAAQAEAPRRRVVRGTFLPTSEALVHKVVASGLVAARLVVGLGKVADGRPRKRPVPVGEIVVLIDNGAWSWFPNERAVIHQAVGALLVSSVANVAGTAGAARHGVVEVVIHDVGTGSNQRSVLHDNLVAGCWLPERPDEGVEQRVLKAASTTRCPRLTDAGSAPGTRRPTALFEWRRGSPELSRTCVSAT